MLALTRDEFADAVRAARTEHPAGLTLAVPVSLRLLADQLTPVLAYRRLVSEDERTAPSFLLESIEHGSKQSRYSLLGAHPAVEVVAYGHITTVHDHRGQDLQGLTGDAKRTTQRQTDPIDVIRGMSSKIRLVTPQVAADRGMLPGCAWGGWFGYASYDTVRYAEPVKLDPKHAPDDDRRLPDVHFGFHDGVVAFDHAQQTVYLVQLALVGADEDPGEHFDRAVAKLEAVAETIQRHSKPLPLGRIAPIAAARPQTSNISKDQYTAMIERALEYIRAGDIFQVVLGQRFERTSKADPFDVYRALRAVNPSPYMVYMQAPPAILVAASPEILCRVEPIKPDASTGSPDGGVRYRVTNRPLAGTRPRGKTAAEDAALEADLLSDAKEVSEHAMLVDLGRNDVGRVARPGSIELDRVMSIERYSHVMHISSTVTGELRDGLDCWDALRAALPVGTISGAPKIRAMQIIDELEAVRRGPYGGGFGYVGLDGAMDIALALRTIVVPLSEPGGQSLAPAADGTWTYHVQAAGGIVADSKIEAEYQETVNKAAAMGRAIDIAETAFEDAPPTD